MLGTASRSPFVITSVVQALLAQDPIKLVSTETAQIMNKILSHKHFTGILSFAQHVLSHVGNCFLPQFRPVPQTLSMSLKYWRTTLHQYLTETTYPCHIACRLQCTDIDDKLTLP